jgi:hypothetical protein
MGGIGSFFQVGASALQAIGKGQQGQSALGDIKSDIDDANRAAQQAERQVVDAQVRGAQAAGVTRMQTSQLVAKQRQAYAAGGVDASTGTAADVQTSTRALGELEAEKVEFSAMREAWGHKEESNTQQRRSGRLHQKYRDQEDANTLATLGSFFEGASDIGKAAGY